MSDLIKTIYSDDNIEDEDSMEIEDNSILKNKNNWKKEVKDNSQVNEDFTKKLNENKNLEKAKEIKKSVILKTEYNWDDLNISKPIRKALDELRFYYPTKIQNLSIPTIVNNNDVLGSSLTGSGKTAAFLIPIIQKITMQKSIYYTDNYSKCLVILPTRELALQCYEMLQSLAKFSKITACLIIGKVSLNVQENELHKGPDFIIATPGRIIDLTKNSKGIYLDNIEILIFDEADKLLEFGFLQEIKEINSICSNEKRQTWLFSATLSKDISKIIDLTLKKPVILKADIEFKVSDNLRQEVLKIRKYDSYRESFNLFLIEKYYKTCKIINFFKTKEECHRMCIILKILKIKYSELHGNLNQIDRIKNLESFKNNDSSILLSTDLAGRGLDITDVNLVINNELPKELSRYVHRVGRTARAGKEGRCITIVNDTELPDLKKIIKKTKGKLYKVKCDKQTVKEVKQKIDNLEKKIKAYKNHEKQLKEIEEAKLQAIKARNILQYEEEIYNRPKREWIMSNRSKKDIQKQSKKRFDEKN